MWECGLKSPQAEEASNPSLNGGPSAVARNAADHRLSCIIDSSPVSVAKSIRMPLHPLPAAVPPQGTALALSLSLSLSLRGGPCRPLLLLPVGFSHCFAGRLGLVRARQKAPTQKGLLLLFLSQKGAPPGFNH